MNPNLLKCKAQQIVSGKWLYGFVVPVIYNGEELRYFILDLFNKFLTIEMRNEIDPNTICKFTGTCDADNQEIYEGDVVDTPHGPTVVCYDDIMMTYILHHENKYLGYLYENDEINVIGNICDDINWFNEELDND